MGQSTLETAPPTDVYWNAVKNGAINNTKDGTPLFEDGSSFLRVFRNFFASLGKLLESAFPPEVQAKDFSCN